MESKVLRAQARAHLQGSWPVSIGVAAVACLLGGMITGSSFLPDIEWRIPLNTLQELDASLRHGWKMGEFGISISNGIYGFAAFLLGGVLQLGYARFLLKQHDGQDVQFNDLFSQFHRFGQGFAQQFLRGLYVTLWSLLLVIPGIMASYSYALTPFLMAEDPELSASDAITRSKELMDGYKAELFLLDLSFFGWIFLAALSGNLGFLALNPYTNAAWAAFYRQRMAQRGWAAD